MLNFIKFYAGKWEKRFRTIQTQFEFLTFFPL